MMTGPTTPSTMCIWNQWRVEPQLRIQRTRLRSGYRSSDSIRQAPTMPSQ